MRLLFRAMCGLGHHAPGASALLWHDGRHFRCPCRGCGRTLIKGEGGWMLLGNRVIGD